MINIPLGKALVPVESDAGCNFCCLTGSYEDGEIGCNSDLCCISDHRRDGKNVIFKLIDIPEKEKNYDH
jgi:hypothetical protein